VNAVTTGNVGGYAVEYHKAGPLYILGATLEGKVGLGSNTLCYSVGTRFFHRARQMSGYVKEGTALPEGSFFRRTGKHMTVPYRRWKGERLAGGVHKEIGFVQLPGTAGARVNEMPNESVATVEVPEGATSVPVSLDGLLRQPDSAYQVLATPNWPAGGVWVTGKKASGFTLNVEKPAPAQGAVDVVIKRSPFRGITRSSADEQ
jgi:hypothetical protein